MDAAISLDVVLHLRDRASFFREVVRTLRAGGRFLLTDAGVVTGSISADEIRRRSQHGHTELVPPGWNEALLEAAGFDVIETENSTPSAMQNASGRLAAFRAHRPELERMLGATQLAAQEAYLATVVEVSSRGRCRG